MLKERSSRPLVAATAAMPKRNWIRALGQPTDRRRFGRDDLERRLSDQEDAVGPAHGLLGVDEPGAVLPRLQNEVTGTHGMGTQVLDERITCHEQQTTEVTLRIFTEPQHGATYDDLLAVARAAEERASTRSSAPTTSSRWAASRPARPDRRVDTLAGLARDTSRIRLGTLVTSATFRLPGPLAITVARWTR